MSIAISYLLCFALGAVVIVWALKSLFEGQIKGLRGTIAFDSRPLRFSIRGGIFLFTGLVFCLGPVFLSTITDHAFESKWLVGEIAVLIVLSLVSYLSGYAGVRYRACLASKKNKKPEQ